MEGPLICFAGGGTGGHLYPALAVAEAIRRAAPQARFLFFGGSRRIDAQILSGSDCESIRQQLRPLSAKPWRWPGIYRDLRSAMRACAARYAADRPGFVLGTGGMASVPAVLQAARMGIRTGILNPDAVPGRANRYLSSKADAVFAQWEVTRRHLPRANVVVAGCPVRGGFLHADRAAGIARFQLDPQRRTLFVTGASQGAKTINDAVLANEEFFRGRHDWQTLHLTGEQDFARVQAAYQRCEMRSAVVAYTNHMAEALAAADLVIARAGASTLAELTAMGRASILLPYPYHKDQHQLANAECLAGHGAARIVRDAVDERVTGPALRKVLDELMGDDSARQRMAERASTIGRRDSADDIARAVLQALPLPAVSTV